MVVWLFDAYPLDVLKVAFRSALPADAVLDSVSPVNDSDGLSPALRVCVSANMASLQEIRSTVLAGEFGAIVTRALAATPRKDPPQLVPGGYARIDNLLQRPQLNGGQALLLSFEDDVGRWSVDAGGIILRVRPSNLFPPHVVVTADATQFAEEHERQVLSQLTLTHHQELRLQECASSKNVHLRAPAGAGKTFVALNRMHTHLTSGSAGRLLYVARNRCAPVYSALPADSSPLVSVASSQTSKRLSAGPLPSSA